MRIILVLLVCLGAQAQQAGSWLDSFSYSQYFSGKGVSVSASAQTNASNCTAAINGVDPKRPTRPFTFIWGDGSTSKGFFPQTHLYADCKRNYVAEVRPDYGSGPEDGAQVRVNFLSRSYVVQPLMNTSQTPVRFPRTVSALGTRLYAPPSNLLPVELLPGVPLPSAEYALSVAAGVQKDFVSENVHPRNGPFSQVVYRSSTPTGMLFSLWFTDPIAFVIAVDLTAVPWSSFIHEMGHNFTLNSPADFYFGGRIDGNANAIYSETMAQIFAHATIYEMARRYRQLGLSDDLMDEIAYDGLATFSNLATQYDGYLSGGRRFSSWNDPQTTDDDTFKSFMTLAFVFLREAGTGTEGYRMPVKRLMEFLQMWNADWQKSYAQSSNSPAAEAFRSTMMIAALSHGVQKDLRSMFRDLNFPVDSATWDQMNGAALDVQVSATSINVPGAGGQFRLDLRPSTSVASWAARSDQVWVRLETGTAHRGAATLTFSVLPNPDNQPRSARIVIGRGVVEIRQEAGPPQVLAEGGVVHGASFLPGIVSGSWVTIQGRNLAGSTRAWRAEDIQGDRLPTTLDGVQVKIGGKPAAVYFISPGQLNVQAPQDTATGPVPVEVIRGTVSSGTVLAELKAVAPALFAYAAGQILFPAAVHLDGVVVGDPGVVAGTRRVRGGDRILLYGTGLERSEAGTVIQTPVAVSKPVRVIIGGKEAVVEYAGLVGPGLFQVNVKLPDLGPGMYPMTLEVAGVSSPPGPVLPVD